MKLATLLLFIFGLQLLYGQREATHPLREQRNLIRKQKALEFLNANLGEDFVERYLLYSEIQPDTKPGVAFDIKNKPNKDGKNLLIVYTTVTNQDSFSFIEVDTTLPFPSLSDLQKCVNRGGDCSFLCLDVETALRLVEKDCLYLGSSRYIIRLVVDNTNGNVKWVITLFDTPDQGEEANINAKTGACEKISWHN